MPSLENFSSLDEQVSAGAPDNREGGVAAKKEAKKEAKKRNLDHLSSLFNQAVHDDPTLLERLETLTPYVRVVNSLGFGESGNLILDKNAKKVKQVIDPETGKTIEEEVKPLFPTSEIFGYRIQNIGPEPIKYNTEKWSKDPETGLWVGNHVAMVLEPGETVDLTKKFITVLGMSPEFSMKFENGTLISKGLKVGANVDVEELLEKFHFIFRSGINMKVNSDEFKIQIGKKVKVGGTKKDPEYKWVVQEAFEQDFGFLNNEIVKTPGRDGRSSGQKKIDQNVLAANYLRELARKQGLSN